MINKLSLIFQHNLFEVVVDKEKIKILKRNDNKYEYFIIVDVETLDVLPNNYQKEYLSTIKEYVKDKEVDKNSTLLICLKSETYLYNHKYTKRF